jgi:adenylate cyclase
VIWARATDSKPVVSLVVVECLVSEAAMALHIYKTQRRGGRANAKHPVNQSKFRTWLLRYGIAASLTMLTGWVVLDWDVFKPRIINPSYDLPFLNRSVIRPTEAVMVFLDDDSHRELGQPYNTSWDRSLYARLVDRLTAEGARAVVFDIIFSDPHPTKPEGDAEFARAIKANGKVILGADFTYTGDGSPTVIRAIDQFLDGAADWGLVQLDHDEDLTVRRHFHVPRDSNADQFSSLSWQTAHFLGVPETTNSENRSIKRWMNYYGPSGNPKIPGSGTIPFVSFYLALQTNELCPSGFFSNKVVFVGGNVKTAFSGERKDEYRTPFTVYVNTFVPGVEVQATEFLNLLRHDWLRKLSDPQEYCIVFVLGALFGIGLARLRQIPATGAALLLAIGVIVAGYSLFYRFGIWFPWLAVIAMLPVALLWSVSYNSLSTYIQNRLLEQSLGAYLSPKQVQRLLKDPSLRQPGGQKQVVSILFSDIAGFSRISEQLDAQDLVQLLNSYYETTIGSIHKTDGTVVDIIGDAIFAVWNAPEPQPDHRERMIQAALLFQKNLQHFNGKEIAFALKTRVGLHTGEVVVGNVGSSEHFDYTAIGENVNLASRLEGLNKQLGTDVLLTPAAIPATPGEGVLRPVGKFQFKGFENVVEVVELVVHGGTKEESQPWRESFASALAEFAKRNWDAAEAGFKRTMQLRPSDGPSDFYLHQIAGLKTQELPADWAGEVSLKEK